VRANRRLACKARVFFVQVTENDLERADPRRCDGVIAPGSASALGQRLAHRGRKAALGFEAVERRVQGPARD
jgi:hypothetical protein